MNILICNKFMYRKGGAEVSMFSTAELLESNGHNVLFFSMRDEKNIESRYEEYFVENVDYLNCGIFCKIKSFFRMIYSFEAKRKIKKLLDENDVDIVHLNNIAHQLSPSIIDEIKARNIPIVMTIRDYKLVCPSYELLENGRVCEKCSGGKYYNCVVTKCHKQSLFNSFAVMVEMYIHSLMNIYKNVDCYISTSRFVKNKFNEMGFKYKIVTIPNFVDIDIYPVLPVSDINNDVIYFGRLSQEKGLITLLKAVKDVGVNLIVIGDGPQLKECKNYVEKHGLDNVRFKGYMKYDSIQKNIKEAMCVVVPSEWYEPFGRSVIEAFAMGKPVIGSDIGGISEIIDDGVNGLLFKPFEHKDLSKKLQWMLDNKSLVASMSLKAREKAEDVYSKDVHYKKLISLYQQVMNSRN